MKRLLILPILSLLAVPTAASARTLSISLELLGASAQLTRELNLTEADLQALLGQRMGQLFNLADLNWFLTTSADAQSAANLGWTTDYASNPDLFVVGLGFGGGIGVNNTAKSDAGQFDRAIPVAPGAQTGFMLGWNLDSLPTGIDLPLTVSVNFGGYKDTINDYDIEGGNYGAHLHYRIVPGVSVPMVGWGGVTVGSGFRVSKLVGTVQQGGIHASAPLSNGIQINTNSTGRLRITQTAMTVPIEVSTNVTLAYFLSFYAVIGADVQLGEAKYSADVVTLISDSYTKSQSGRATIQVEESLPASSVVGRGQLGLQLNLWKFRLFGELGYSTAKILSGAAGLRFAY